MCTVTFLPDPRGTGYLLGMNRDERPSRREALPPERFECEGVLAGAPMDGEAGGTWIAANERGAALCLINGDDGGPGAARPDAPSRGLLVRELAAAATARDLGHRLEQRRLRENPFRLLFVEPAAGGPPAWHRFTWNGSALLHSVAHGPQLEVSNGHDQARVAAWRRARFTELLAAPAEHPLAGLASWHAGHRPEAPEGDVFSVCMHHTVAHTVSLTVVHVEPGSVQLHYRPGPPCRAAPFASITLPRSLVP